ncbi:hypothetical protein SUGI_0892670 [Cryptomeria japonica]|uniref:putative UPF0481 protein At3g02645 n=1 Tax=Cryptomeria japonica TaxID=3369 RepID=UPI0024149768|nr:putative UPF0481 protein At3g02645 [Cryptomeria japonica]GLJ43013.1 hypothetical protein SUGI_0892670 [Cryptomeria japonica]
MDEQTEQCVVYIQYSLGDEPALHLDQDHTEEYDAAFHQDQEKVHWMNKWLVEARNSLNAGPFFLEEEVIYPVPLCLKNDNTVSFYHPKEISFGPRHFGFCPKHFKQEEVDYDGLEIFKSEVASEFDGRLRGGLISLVKKLESEMQEKIKKSYGMSDDETGMGSEVLAWLLARDGCFVLEVLKRFSVEDPAKAENRQKTVLQNILNRKNHHPLLNDIVKDMFKLENQLPLWVLKEIKERQGELEAYWFERALKNLSPVEVRDEIGSRQYKREIHLLQLLGEYMVDNEKPLKEEEDQNQDGEEAVSSKFAAVGEVGNNKKRGKYIIMGLVVIFFVLLCIFLSPVFTIWFLWLVISLMWESYQNYKWGEADKDDRHVPTVEELHRIGVKFKKLKHRGISHINFDKKHSILYLPKFTVDDKSEVILRNLLVMETHRVDSEKIITRYVVLMNDLVNTTADVSRLRQEGIISNKLGSDEDVARLCNSVTIPATDIPSYGPIDAASSSINAYRKKGLKILWAQFRRVHCSKPWLLASLLGGISLLLLTVVQVVCLFHSCKRG